MLVVSIQLTSSTWWGNPQRVWLRILSVALEEELDVFDFVFVF